MIAHGPARLAVGISRRHRDDRSGEGEDDRSRACRGPAAGGSRERLGGVRDRGLAVHGGRRPAVAQRRRLQRRRAPRRGDDQRDELQRVGVPAPGRRRLRAGGGLADRGRRPAPGRAARRSATTTATGWRTSRCRPSSAGNVSVLLRQPGGGFALEGARDPARRDPRGRHGRLQQRRTARPRGDDRRRPGRAPGAQRPEHRLHRAAAAVRDRDDPGRDRRRRLQRRRAGRPGDRQPGQRQRDDPAAGPVARSAPRRRSRSATIPSASSPPTSTATAAPISRSPTPPPAPSPPSCAAPSNDGFTAEPPITVSASPVGIDAADFDRDGRPDLAVAANAGAVEILRRNAGGGFTRDQSIPLAGAVNDVAAADFDGDSRPDLAASSYTNATADTFTALLNPAPRRCRRRSPARPSTSSRCPAR